MSEPDFSGYVQSLGPSFTLDALIVTFIFTALTLVLVETPDIANLLVQAALLVLMVAFLFALFSLGILDRRMIMLNPKLKATPPYTPGWRFHNLLLLLSVLLMNMSIVLMMFYRGLTILGSVSLAIVVLWFTVYIIYISPWRIYFSPWRFKRRQNK